jgi:hypothetical protein
VAVGREKVVKEVSGLRVARGGVFADFWRRILDQASIGVLAWMTNGAGDMLHSVPYHA